MGQGESGDVASCCARASEIQPTRRRGIQRHREVSSAFPESIDADPLHINAVAQGEEILLARRNAKCHLDQLLHLELATRSRR